MASRETGTAGRIRALRGGRRLLASGWGMLVLGTLLAEHGGAQTARLTVRPHELKGAEQTAQTGDLPLDSLPGYSLYASPACMGKPRCPLLVAVADIPQAAGGMPQTLLGWMRPVADKYGLIVLALDPYLPTQPDTALFRRLAEPVGFVDPGIAPRRLDAALTQVFQKCAVDPDRIALLGYHSYVGAPTPKVLSDAWPLAVQNLDVFSRVVLSSIDGDLPLPPAPLPAQPTRFLLTSEAFGFPHPNPQSFVFANALRQRGYPAEFLLAFRGRGRGLWEELDFVGRWLRDSWSSSGAVPQEVSRPLAGGADGDSLPLLTPDAINRLAQFWTSFQQEPDSIRRLARRAHLRELALPIGTAAEHPLVVMTDMAALAATFPTVAAKLKAAGLTAQEHDAYRLALVSAKFADAFSDSTDDATGATSTAPTASVVAAGSIVAKNVAFLQANPVFRGIHSEGLGPASATWLWSGMWEVP